MAGYASIAGVTATLRKLLRDRMEDPVTVTVARPDITVSGVSGRRVNVYLYHVEENGFLANQDLPGAVRPGERGHPPLSLDLHYLLTGYAGTENAIDADLEAQQTLGDAMRVLHDYPVVTGRLHEDDDPTKPAILDPSLVGEFEQIKIDLQQATLDDLSKLWSVLPETNYRRSVAYHVSAVQIESQARRRSALPVRRRTVKAVGLRTPRIDEVFREPPLGGFRAAVAEVGETIRIVGTRLADPTTRVLLGYVSIPVPSAQDTQLDVSVPAALGAGLHPVQVQHDLELGDPETLHRGFQSNLAALLVIPRIAAVTPPSAGAGDTLTVTVDPPVRPGQRVSLLVGDTLLAALVPSPPPLPSDPPSATVQFRLPAAPGAIPAGTHLVRVRVDGAESRLGFDTTTGLYNSPTYTVT